MSENPNSDAIETILDRTYPKVIAEDAENSKVMDENLKSTLKRADLLGRDPREKERKKFGLKKARKQRQFTKR